MHKRKKERKLASVSVSLARELCLHVLLASSECELASMLCSNELNKS